MFKYIKEALQHQCKLSPHLNFVKVYDLSIPASYAKDVFIQSANVGAALPDLCRQLVDLPQI